MNIKDYATMYATDDRGEVRKLIALECCIIDYVSAVTRGNPRVATINRKLASLNCK